MNILITGETSYAGTQFARRIADIDKGWNIDFLSVRNNDWEKSDFSKYDVIYHVAGIVHIKESIQNKDLYFKVNSELTYNLAEKAKKDGVETFIFLSTIAVYGLQGAVGKEIIISKETKEKPTTYYGESKLKAEELLNKLVSKKFNIIVLRVPMIYGPKCPGNYNSLALIAKKTFIFPKINNKRSFIYIDYLSDLVIYLIESKGSGLFLVSNPEDLNTLDIVETIARLHEKKIYFSFILGFLIKILGNRFMVTKKVFGNLSYKNEDCKIEGFESHQFDFLKSIASTEGKTYS